MFNLYENCEHDFKAKWDHNQCVKCGAVRIGMSKLDQEDFGIACGKVFKSMEEAKFYQKNGFIPQ